MSFQPRVKAMRLPSGDQQGEPVLDPPSEVIVLGRTVVVRYPNFKTPRPIEEKTIRLPVR